MSHLQTRLEDVPNMFRNLFKEAFGRQMGSLYYEIVF